MTSLASQLQRLAVPYTQTVLGADKRRVSLLFNPKDAAELDRQAVYAIGISGLEELEGIDPAFSEYNMSLFNLSSQNWERTLQTSEVNTQLDETIARFLIHISPYFLLTPAHKTLEWLVYRYHIHQMNIDDLLRCVLPYHETKMFVRVVQLLPIQSETHKWHWLHSCGKSGVVLPRSSLINHCRSDPAFLSLVAELPVGFGKELGWESKNLRTVVALWTCTLLGVITERANVTERVMGILVPALTRSLKSKCDDLKAGAYMVLSQLVSHTVLQPQFISTLLPVFTKHISPKLSREALLCLALVIQTQKVESLPKKCVKKLSSLPALVQTLSVLSDRYEISPLVSCLLHRLVPMAIKAQPSASSSSDDDQERTAAPQYDVILSGLLSDVSMDTNMATQFTKSLLRELVAANQTREEEEWKSACRAFLSILQTRYSVSVDLAVDALVGGSSKEVDPNHLQQVLQAAMGGARGRLIDGSTSLLLALSHTHSTTRVLALSHLKEVLSQEGGEWKEEELGTVMIDRLNDDDRKVVAATLGLDKLLFKVLSRERLTETLVKLIKSKQNQSKWSAEVVLAVNLLCSDATSPVSQNLGVRLLPCLLMTDIKSATPSVSLATPTALLRSPIATKDPILGPLSKEWLNLSQKVLEGKVKENEGLVDLNLLVIHSASKVLIKLDNKKRKEMIELLKQESSKDPVYELVCVCLLREALSEAKTETTVLELSFSLITLITPALKAMQKLKAFPGENLSLKKYLSKWLRRASSESTVLAPATIWWTLEAVVGVFGQKKVKLPESVWWSVEQAPVSLLLSCLDLLLGVSCHHGYGEEALKLWHNLVKTLTQDVLDLLTFSRLAGLVCRLHVSPNVSVSPTLQVAMTHLLASSWRSATREQLINLLEGEDSPVLPGLLLCLGSSEESMRSGAVLCVKAARKAGSKDVGKLSTLFKKISKQQEEITADKSHIQNILSRVLSHEDDLVNIVVRWTTQEKTPSVVTERLLHHLQSTPNEHILDGVLCVGERALSLCEENTATSTHLSILAYLIQRLTLEEAASLKVNSPRLNFLLRAIHTSSAPAATKAIEQVSKEFFHALPSEKEKQTLVSAILDVAEKPANSDLGHLAHLILQQVRLELEHVQHELQLTEGEDATPTTVKARRRSKAPNAIKQFSWLRVTTLLEVLQTRRTVNSSESMVSLLFSLLIVMQKNEGDEWDYRQRLLLAVIHNLTSRWQQQQLTPKQESVNVECLVRSVRNPASSMQTKQHALAVMANLAHFFPEHLLHHVMSIFTFVGEGLMAADDAHSLSVVSRTITTIIPALLSAENTAAKARNQLINQIVQVFVDAQRSVPRHRSLTVFTTLVTTLGTENSLWRILTLLVATATQHREQQTEEDVRETSQDVKSMERDMEFGLSVCQQFDLTFQVEAATRVVLFLKWLAEQHGKNQNIGNTKTRSPKVKGKPELDDPVTTIVDVGTLSAHQMRVLQYQLTTLLTRMLTNEELVAQVVEKENIAGDMFQVFVQESVMYMLTVARLHTSVTNTAHVKFWKAVMGKSYEILDKVLYLLPTPVLLEVVSTLLAHNLPGVKRKSLDLLASKLQALLVTPPSGEEENSLLSVLQNVMEIAMVPTAVNDADVSAIQQLALYNVKLLCKTIGEKYQKIFLEILQRVMTLITVDGTPAVVGSAMLVEAEVVAVVRAHAIPHLPKMTTPLLDMLSDPETASNELVLTCGLTALHRLVATLPHFLSPYLRRILKVVCEINALSVASDKSQADLRLAAIRHQLSTVVAARVLVPALNDTFSDIASSSTVTKGALISVMSIYKEHVEAMSKEDLSAQHTPLLTLLCSALDLRSTNKQLSPEDVSAVEKSVIEAAMAMVVRLSEASFRPMFYKLYDWACREDTPQTRLRKLTFFNLADSLAAKLRGLFNLFIGHALQAACTILTSNNSLHGDVTYFDSGSESVRLSSEVVSSVLACLTKCMTHDSEGLFSGEIFNMLLQPLVDQIENFVGSEEEYERRMSQLVVPCLSHFMVAAKEDSHQKALNYQVLLKARNVSPKVRFGALRVISGIASQMGDEYVVLLPETIPFLAELMEDESEEVERECQLVISNLEDVLGESLQKYF